MDEPAIPNRHGFKKPKLWDIQSVEFYEGTGKFTGERQRSVKVGVVAESFDRALTAFRIRHPHARISSIALTNSGVDLIVDDPVVADVVELLEG